MGNASFPISTSAGTFPLEELEKRDDLTAEFKGYLAAGYLEQKAKWCAPYRRALAELKKMKT